MKAFLAVVAAIIVGMILSPEFNRAVFSTVEKGTAAIASFTRRSSSPSPTPSTPVNREQSGLSEALQIINGGDGRPASPPTKIDAMRLELYEILSRYREQKVADHKNRWVSVSHSTGASNFQALYPDVSYDRPETWPALDRPDMALLRARDLKEAILKLQAAGQR